MSSVIEPGNLAVVTGAGSGIGRGLALKFAELGLRVVVVGRTERSVQETVSLLPGRGHLARRVDVSDPDQTDALAADLSSNVGPVRVLCNNAGVPGNAGASMWEL